MKYKILLINPPYERLKGFSVESIPLGLLSIGTVLNTNGYTVKVYDADTSFEAGKLNYDNLNRAKAQSLYLENLKNDNYAAWQELKFLLAEFRPDIIGVSMMTPTYSACRKIFKIIKESCPQALLIAGGPHVTICKDAVLKDNPEIDFGFSGEAEYALLDFLKQLGSDRDFGVIKGLFYRDGANVVFAGDRPFIDNLDLLPFPERGLLHNEKKYRPAKLTQMMTSRGCPFECTFCASVPLWKRKVRRRSPEKLIEEISYLAKKYRVRSFEFWDDTFTTNKNDVIRFCRLLIAKFGKNKFVWKCLTNINCFDSEMLDWLKKAGCRTINIGIESGSDRILKAIKKNITTDRVRDAVKTLKKKKFLINAFFMVGIPQETEEDINKTILFMKELEPDSVNLCTFTPYVGTELYNYVVLKGFIAQGDYSIYDKIGHHSVFNFFMEDISRERYGQLLQEILLVSTEISNKKTLRKFVLKLKGLTFEKIRYRLKQLLQPKRG